MAQNGANFSSGLNNCCKITESFLRKVSEWTLKILGGFQMVLPNRSSVFLGSLIIFYVLYFGVIEPAVNPALYLNFHALMIVIFGTVGITLVSYPFKKLADLADFIIFGVYLSGRKRNRTQFQMAIELVEATESYFQQSNMSNFEFSHPFTKECFVALSKKKLSTKQLMALLHNLKDSITDRYFDDAKTLNAISKFPPALGLLGASTGMIEMMQQVGSAGGTEQIGKAMATALVATFWGIAGANFVILPLSDLALRQAEEEQKVREFVIDVIYLIKEKYSRIHIYDFMLSKFPLKERIMFKDVIKEIVLLDASDGKDETPDEHINESDKTVALEVYDFQKVANRKK
jgi:chemotaxis protein MotA